MSLEHKVEESHEANDEGMDPHVSLIALLGGLAGYFALGPFGALLALPAYYTAKNIEKSESHPGYKGA